mmetsp:Transcript_35521/g.83180  ORF Transcript_35521/g.83180 Transcript_35521/m.83180 type:complete len:275 (-) Transcript_35521:18-842(-)
MMLTLERQRRKRRSANATWTARCWCGTASLRKGGASSPLRTYQCLSLRSSYTALGGRGFAVSTTARSTRFGTSGRISSLLRFVGPMRRRWMRTSCRCLGAACSARPLFRWRLWSWGCCSLRWSEWRGRLCRSCWGVRSRRLQRRPHQSWTLRRATTTPARPLPPPLPAIPTSPRSSAPSSESPHRSPACSTTRASTSTTGSRTSSSPCPPCPPRLASTAAAPPQLRSVLPQLRSPAQPRLDWLSPQRPSVQPQALLERSMAAHPIFFVYKVTKN